MTEQEAQQMSESRWRETEHTRMPDQPTFVRDGKMYHTDRETYDVLRVVQKWDSHSEHNLAQDVFDKGVRTGRINEGPGNSMYREPVVAHAPGMRATIGPLREVLDDFLQRQDAKQEQGIER